MRGDPLWLQIARADIGLREIPGAPTAPKIAGWLAKLKAAWGDDETPWCGTAVAAWINDAGGKLPKHWYRAKGWLDWGESLTDPVVGCVVVFSRDGGGHVGLVVGVDARNRLMVLGGNQGNAVSIVPFDQTRVLGFRWPTDIGPAAEVAALPLLLSSGESSANEA